ncbi:hypothetical protein FWK45_08835 [Histophilus somni]|uniref:Uncharacterized protein n=1 Tax=Histophilus somni TaxID=731 RepID=A0A9Q6Z022_HISSO|nr:hypothetical protein [Histophilus somni]ARU65477.1 hypothetical protein BTV18_08195 [Histophilus somni]ARU67344.1 hypothetical protein BTV19_08625 [Histophilus somni]ARU69224.1 hypothetical protein BTV16_08640 [Histophilus somni]ARU71101.1 hypothetical protein BTV20_08645 [Histophilus somni]ARU72972.1 hypothetical protein BTV17_08620 [Histophilus somni]
MSKRQYRKSTEEKLDQILAITEIINQKVDKQNEELVKIKNDVQALERLVQEMARKNRNTALIAGGISGGLVAVGIELIRVSLAG